MKWSTRLPIRIQLSLWYVAFLAVVLAGFGFGVYWSMERSLRESLDEAVERQAASLSAAIVITDGAAVLVDYDQGADPEFGEYFLRTYTVDGAVAFDTSSTIGDIPIDEDAVARALSGRGNLRSVASGDVGLRIETAPLIRGGQVVGALEVGLLDGKIADAMSSLVVRLAVGYPIALLVAAIGSVWLVRRAFAPVEKVTNLARGLSAGALDQRLNLNLPDDETGRLSRTFDEMLERLEDAFRRQRQFTADASHELRTPLTIMRGQIDVALRGEDLSESARATLTAIDEAVHRLTRLVGSLLTLARADSGEVELSLEEFDLGFVIQGVVEQLSPLAAERGVSLSTREGQHVSLVADEDLCLQLLINLTDNALKFTGRGGEVTLGWGATETEATFWVADNGSGIPSEHLPHVFDRFYRVDPARTARLGGAGLGLAICHWIAQAHGGSIHVSSSEGVSTRFEVSLPLHGNLKQES